MADLREVSSDVADAADKDGQHEDSADFKPRAYQVELYEAAKKQNSILVLGTGSGKTFISILLIKEYADEIRGSLSSGSKRTVFVVNTVPLVHQQALAIQTHTPLNVGKYEGSLGVDFWSVEKWKEELEKNEVLVFVAQIFCDLVLHAKFSLSSVNLLIMDECHHATGCHPMREIMRQYHSLKTLRPERCPRVLGLTACVIQSHCGKKDVTGGIRKLEAAMDCALVTATDQDEVMRHSTAPGEVVVCYGSHGASAYRQVVEAQLNGISQEVNGDGGVENRVKKAVRKKIENVRHILRNLGDWCAARAIKYEIDHFEEAVELEDVPAVQGLLRLLGSRFRQIHGYCVGEEAKMDHPKDHVSNKVQRLLEILGACRREACGLIFVERRCTAKILYDLLLEVAARDGDLSSVRPAYIVSSHAHPGIDIRLAALELQKQRETLEKFRRGECNFIVSTSILEEGVDVRKCNLVVRFDRPMNYRAFVQSRGRARARPSKYILMVEEGDLPGLLETVEVYKEIEKVLTLICHGRRPPTASEMWKHYRGDEHLAPYEPYGSCGPKVTLNSAVPLVNVYCSKLPHDKFTELSPEVSHETSDEGKFVTGIRLPINSCLKHIVYGDSMETKDLAKKSAAMNVCKELHARGELDEHLRPVEASDDSLLEGLVEIPHEEASEEGGPEPGTKKRRQVYEKGVCEAFTHSDGGPYYVYSLSFRPRHGYQSKVVIDSSRCERTVGLMVKRKLAHFPFSLYFPKWEEVEVRMRFVEELVNLCPEVEFKVGHFHRLIFETLISVNKSLLELSCSGVYIVPIGSSGTIDWDIVNQMAPLTSLRHPMEHKAPDKTFHFERCVFEDAIIYPLYGSQSDAMYYVCEILDGKNPQSEFYGSRREYYSYEDYFLKKYGMKITNREQPLITAKHLPKELNYLRKIASTGKNDKSNDQYVARYVPELCGVLPLKASLWWQIMCVPSILFRLNSLNLAQQLNADMNIVKNLSEVSDLSGNVAWTEEIVKRALETHKDNLSVVLVKKRSDYIDPYMLLHALTHRGANDCFDLERLEVLGDSFLKYITADCLFSRDFREHEGKLSLCRGKLVCNRTLYSLAKMKKIPEKIQAIRLSPQTNGLLPGFTLKNSVARKLRRMGFPHQFWPLLPDIGDLDNLEEEAEKVWRKHAQGGKVGKEGGVCYNPWTEQELSDKSIADSVEALIGAYLLVCGSQTAITFLHKLGLGVYNGECLLKSNLDIPSPVLSKEDWAREEIMKLYHRACLDRLEEKIQYSFSDKAFIVQAVTHSSFISNKVTDCYQRLEFLGDAVLDFLVTGHVYSRYASYSPGQMTDLRSYYVKNETLAKIAAKMELHKHLLYLASKLQTSIDKFLNILKDGLEENDLNTEKDEVNSEDVDVPKALGDLVESIIGAVYLDSGRSMQKAWKVVEVLMGDLVKETLVDIPIDCVRQLYEVMPQRIKFKKVPRKEGDDEAVYELEMDGFPALYGKGKNYRTAKAAAAKLGLRKLHEADVQKGISFA